MIYFDVTKTGSAAHRSGLTRVSARLSGELGAAAQATDWPTAAQRAGAGDWFLTAELFSEIERPGFTEFLTRRTCRLAAIFHDAIPLKHPHITWPQSVARHAGYMKLLSGFDRVWAVSAASREELLGFWRWQGVTTPPPVDVLALGADFNGRARVTDRPAAAGATPQLLCVGILEPRKNQDFLLDVCEGLWREGRQFELHVVGRVNPHFGRAIVARLKEERRHFPGLCYHEAASDAVVAKLYATARASVFPTIAEGCGLPLLESLWMGVPCVCSDLPVLRENADGGGCVPVAPDNRAAWHAALGRVLRDDAWHAQLVREAATRELPTWAEAADTIRRGLGAT
ncbi:MAG: glycosyltransferase [Verrucomicrobia bacterium]|nr:glycosyltransferase [Verrucomicrobiota bacterium]